MMLRRNDLGVAGANAALLGIFVAACFLSFEGWLDEPRRTEQAAPILVVPNLEDEELLGVPELRFFEADDEMENGPVLKIGLARGTI